MAWLRRPLAVGLVAVAVATGGGAWACVPQPVMTLEPRGSGPAGSEVTVRAIVLTGDAEVRWNAIDGPLLAKATGPEFSVPVTIPAVEPGLYTVIVFERAPNGSVGNKATASFLVTPEVGTTAAASRRSDAAAQPQRPAPSSGETAQDGIPPAVAVAGGTGLLALGGLAGAAVSRRRRPRPAPASGPLDGDDGVREP